MFIHVEFGADQPHGAVVGGLVPDLDLSHIAGRYADTIREFALCQTKSLSKLSDAFSNSHRKISPFTVKIPDIFLSKTLEFSLRI
jgi:hypothetical protein